MEGKAKSEALDGLLKNTCDEFIFANKNGDHVAISMKGTEEVLISLARTLCKSLRESLEEHHPKELVDKLMQTILKSDEQLDAEVDQMKKEIPMYLKRLMGLLEDLEKENPDDSADETDGKEEDDSCEKSDKADGIDPDVRIRLDHFLHNIHDDNE